MDKSQTAILMACTHHWDSPMQVGSQHLGRQFMKNGYRIGYLSAPLTPLHLAKFSDRELWYRFRQSLSPLQEHPAGVVKIVPFSLIAPTAQMVFNSAPVFKLWYGTTIPYLIRRLKNHRFYSPDILYIDNLTYWFLADLLRPGKMVFRVMDNYMGIPGVGPATRKIFDWLCSKVDLVVYTARSLSGLIEPNKPRSALFVPNGVDLECFARNEAPIPDEYRKIKAPIAVYVGDMDKRFDLDLLDYVIKKLGHVSFVIIGPEKRAGSRFNARHNVFFLGPRPYSRIPDYLRHARVGIIPFNARKYPALINTICPLKLFQYMASGLKVVSTRWKELELMKSPATLCQTYDEFADAVDMAVANEYDPKPYLEYASRAGWDKRAGAILEKLMNRPEVTV